MYGKGRLYDEGTKGEGENQRSRLSVTVLTTLKHRKESRHFRLLYDPGTEVSHDP